MGPLWRIPSTAGFLAKARREAGRKPASETAYRDVRWLGAGQKPRNARNACAIGAAFSFAHFFWQNKRNGPVVRGRNPAYYK